MLSEYFHLGSEEFNNSIDFEFNDISMETKMIVRPDNIAIRFTEKSYPSGILGLIPDWVYKSSNEYISRKFTNLSSRNIIVSKCD